MEVNKYKPIKLFNKGRNPRISGGISKVKVGRNTSKKKSY